jgi:phage antirepressor YoqD-like protein
MPALQIFENSPQTMSSREIAELTGKRHDHVLADIRKTLEEAGIEATEFSGALKMSSGQTATVYNLPRRECDLVVSGYSVKYRLAIIDRWQELEAGKSIKVPQTLSEALRLAADLHDKVIEQGKQLELAKPAVAFVENFVEAKSSKCLTDVAKILGKKPQAFMAKLADDGVIFKRGGVWIPHQRHIDAGRFSVKVGQSVGFAYEQTRVEPKGIEWLAKHYAA